MILVVQLILYFGKINNNANADSSYNFVFGNNININASTNNFENNLILVLP